MSSDLSTSSSIESALLFPKRSFSLSVTNKDRFGTPHFSANPAPDARIGNDAINKSAAFIKL